MYLGSDLRAEIDAYPGHRSPERADPMNRAFHAVVAAVLRRHGAHDPVVISTLLRCAVERHLAAEDRDDDQIRRLVCGIQTSNFPAGAPNLTRIP